MTVKSTVSSALAKAGLSIHRIGSRQKRLFEDFAIDHVIDVGANAGQYAQSLRKNIGYDGAISSFEPLSAAYETLESRAESDAKWHVYNCALGDQEGLLDINVSENSVSSSFLPMLPDCEAAAPHATYVSNESVKVRTLDSLFHECCKTSENVFLKIDTQGFEKQVLDGASGVLPAIGSVELELSLVPLYADQMLFLDMCDFMARHGYEIVSIEPGFSDPKTGRMLQVDGIFHRYEKDIQ